MSPRFFNPFISESARLVLDRLKEAGYESYVVGGAVRDVLLGHQPKDFDIATSAKIDEIRRVFEGEKLICPTGEKHGTITVRLNEENVEITTFKAGEGEEASLISDLSRRDITINSMAFGEGGLIDIMGSKEDLDNKIIRFNSPMDRTIEDDPLRMLRALRFHVTLGFTIDEESKSAIIRNAYKISRVAEERVNKELLTIMLASDIEALLFDYKELFFTIFPVLREMDGYDQNSPWHKHDLYTHTVHVVSKTKRDILLRFAALFHDVGKLYSRTEGIIDGVVISHYYGHPFVSEKIAKELFTKRKLLIGELSKILFLIREHDRKVMPTRKSVSKFLYELNKVFKENPLENLELFLSLQEADHIDHALPIESHPEECLKIAREILDEGLPIEERGLSISGDEIRAIGFKKEGIAEAKKRALLAVMEGRIKNENEPLRNYISALYKSGLR